MEAAEKEVAVNVGWLNSSMPSNARYEGENKWPVTAQQQRQAAAPTPWAHPRKLRKGTDEDVNRESLGYPCKTWPVPHFGFPRRFTI